MSRNRYRFCEICRGDDDTLLACIECSKKYHIECLRHQPKTSKIDPTKWKCEDCENGFQCVAVSVNRMTKTRNFHNGILKNRAKFLKENRKYFQSFNDSDTAINKLINLHLPEKKKQSNKKSASITEANSDREEIFQEVIDTFNRFESPSYINGCLRAYQCIGASKMLSWFQRGVGGILAGNSCEVSYDCCACFSFTLYYISFSTSLLQIS